MSETHKTVRNKYTGQNFRVLLPIEPDGNCLPRCLAQGVDNDQNEHPKMRAKIWQNIEQNPNLCQEDYQIARDDPVYKVPGTTFNDWVEHNKKDGVYGNLVDIKAFTRVYEGYLITIILFNAKNARQTTIKIKNGVVLEENFDDSDVPDEKHIKLKLKGQHYDLYNNFGNTSTGTNRFRGQRFRVWFGRLDKHMHREEFYIRFNEALNVEFGNPVGTNCIKRLDVPLADKNDKNYEVGHHNQGSCTVFFKDQKYAEFFLDHCQFKIRPTKYEDRKTKQIKESRAKTEWVDIRTPDHRSENSKPFNNFTPVSRFLNKSTARTRAGLKAFVPETNTVQPSCAEVLEISTNGFNEQSSDNSASQPAEVCVEIQTNADLQLTRSREGPQESPQEGPQEGPQEFSQKIPQEFQQENSESSESADVQGSQEGPKEVAEEVVEEVAVEVGEEVGEEVLEEVAAEVLEEVAEEVLEEVLQELEDSKDSEDSEGLDVDTVDTTDADLGPALSQVQSDLFRHYFF